MKNRESTESWLARACAAIGYTPETARELWISARSGDPQARQELNRVQREYPRFTPVWEHFAKQSRNRRRDQGKKNPKTFGSPEQAQKGAWERVIVHRVNGVNTIHSGGLPSLGKGSR